MEKGRYEYKTHEIIDVINNSSCPEDVFGYFTDVDDTDKIYQSVYTKYKQICSVIHPDKRKTNKDLCEKAFAKLSALWVTAKKRIEQKIYGKVGVSEKNTSQITFRSLKYTYTILKRLSHGETRGIFLGTLSDKKNNTVPCVIKIPHSPKDNDLMKREYDSYVYIKNYIKTEQYYYFDNFMLRFPSIIESVTIKNTKTGTEKISNIFAQKEDFSKCFTVEQIRNKFLNGVNTKISSFIFNRILETLTFAHSAKTCNGAVTPNHILINSTTHDGTIIDWTSSFRLFPAENAKLPFLDKQYEDFYPNDIVNKERRYHMSDDVFSAAACIFYVLGGCLKTKTISKNLDTNMLSFLNKCMQPSPRKRPNDAIVAYQEFQTVLDEMFGKKREFVVLEM